MKRVHYIDNYLINPQHPVTVNLIGAGGTGSQVLTCLARLDTALRGLGHPGLFVTLYDSDIVTEANIGRQLFSPSDIGLNKAQCLVTRMNNFFGNDWKAVPDIYPAALKDARRDNLANIMITCTDNIKSRLDLWNILKAVPVSEYRSHETPLYWMDFGNTQDTGQVVLGTVPKKIRQPESKLYETVESLKVITRYVKYARVKEKDSGPSCSLAEALEKQDLFINSTLAQLGCNILWKMFRNGMIEIYRGLWLLSWFVKEFGTADAIDAKEKGMAPEALLDERIRDLPAGSDGLLLQPYWTAGILHPDSLGAVIGFSDYHTRYHFYRAIIEGLCLELYMALRIMEDRSGLTIHEIRIGGGGAKSDVVCQIAADVFGLPVVRSQTHEACSIGSSMVAFVAKGVFADFDAAAKAMVHVKDTFQPNERNHEVYNDIYEQAYRKIYPRLRSLVWKKAFMLSYCASWVMKNMFS